MRTCLLYLFALITFCFLSKPIQAQEQEIGGWIGMASYSGDLNTNFSLKGIRPAIGVLYRYHLVPYIALKGSASYARLGFSDTQTPFAYQQARNLSFKTNIIEVSGQVELNFTEFMPGNSKKFFTPYITTGIALFHFSPKAEIDGTTYNLREIGTEGQNFPEITQMEPYRNVQLAVPLGIGLKYWMRGPWSFNTELSYRATFTDYLDDASSVYTDNIIFGDGTVGSELADRSGEVGLPIGDPGQQRGDSTGKDGYFFLSVGITYAIFSTKCPANSSFKPRQSNRNGLF